MSDVDDQFASSLSALSQLMVAEESLEETLQRVAYVACMSPIGADCAGVTLQRSGGPTTAAFHGDAALALDRAQYEAHQGPCLTAATEGLVLRLDSIESSAARWPRFAAVAAEHGIVSSLSLPLTINLASVGALNLYAMAPAPFTDGAVELAKRFAQQAAVAVANSEVYWRTVALTQNLELALENRDLIGQAKGVLMATLKIDATAAFDMLRRTSQHTNIKLREVADHVVRTGELPTPRP